MGVIEIRGATKQFGSVTAFRDVNLTVEAGEMFGLVGPDGAGKTSLIRCLVTMLSPDTGTITVDGLDAKTDATRIRTRLGYMPQRFSLYQDLSVEQNLNFFADIFGVPKSGRRDKLAGLYAFSGLEPFRKRRAGALSGGMKQKLALSCNLIHRPEILLLDEPTFGVDPVSREEFWEILRGIRREGTTILVSTPYMDEAERFDRLAFMFDGHLHEPGTPAALRTAHQHPLYRIEGVDIRAIRAYFTDKATSTQLFGDALHVSFRSDPSEADWKTWEKALSGIMKSHTRKTPSIEDVFLALIGGDHA